VAFVALVRPGDAVYLAVPLLVAALLVTTPLLTTPRLGRRWDLAGAVAGGLAAGGLEWVIEAFARFGGVTARLHQAGAEQNGFGLHLALGAELRALNGPTLCRPCTVGFRQPELDLWWFVLPVLVALGIVAARRTLGCGRLVTALLPAVCGVCLAAQYLFMIDYAAPRFLLPAYAVLAIPAADGLAFLIAEAVRWDLRPAAGAMVACLLAAQIVAQHAVLDHEVGGTVRFHDDYTRIAAVLAGHGVRPPCLIGGVQYIPVGYAAGCASAGTARQGEAVALLIRQGSRPPGYARNWVHFRITGTAILKVNGYVRKP
jgi:hypothetical protein